MNIKKISFLLIVACATLAMVAGCIIDTGGEDPPTTYRLDVHVTPLGSGSVLRSPNETRYSAGTAVILTARANAGYEFTGWRGALSSPDTSVTVTMNSNLSLTAAFQRAVTRFTVSFDTDDGDPRAIDPVTVDSGKALETSTPPPPADPTRSGHIFGGWFDGPTLYTASTVITKNITLTARWALLPTPDGQFNPDIAYDTFTDIRDGLIYRTVTIGEQTWMAENLNYAATVGQSWCYGGNSASCAAYGRLYNWSAAVAACPDGWHLPGQDEWVILTNYQSVASSAGAKLKSKIGWNDYDGKSGNGGDDYGFSAVPGGACGGDNRLSAMPSSACDGGNFSRIGTDGYWWTHTEYQSGQNAACGMHMSHEWDMVWCLENSGKGVGYSVRCVKGNNP